MGKGGFFSGFLCAAKFCVAIALAVCAVVEYLSVWGGEDMYLLLLYELLVTLSFKIASILIVDLRFVNFEM